jgi:hypothetical protein
VMVLQGRDVVVAHRQLCVSVYLVPATGHSISTQVYSGLQVRALAGPLKDIQRLVPKPLLHCLGSVLRIVVLLEGESLLQFEVSLLPFFI